MAIPFLNNISLSNNQLQNAKLHVTGTAPAAEAAQIYYNSGTNIAQYYNGTGWVQLVASTGGTVTSVTSGNANTITIGGTATDPTVAANTAAITNGSLNLATGDQIYDFVTGLGYVESVGIGNSQFVSLADSGTSADPILTASLSATGTPGSATFLRGDNTWDTAITSLKLAASSGTGDIVATSGIFTFTGTGTTTTSVSGTTVTINSTDQHVGTVTSVATTHAGNAFTASIGGVATVNPSVDITMAGSGTQYINGLGNLITFPTIPTVGDGILTVQGTGTLGGTGTFTANQSGNTTISVTHNAQAQSNTTAQSNPNFGDPFTAISQVVVNATGHLTGVTARTVTIPSFPTISLAGDVTGSGTTSISTTISAGAVDFAMVNPAAVITESEGIGNNDNDTTWPTTAAVKDYVDSSVAGQLVYQGGYNANTNTPNLDATPTITIKVGFTWTVTADGLFYSEQVRVGDLLISEVDAPTTLTDWTTVQNNIDLASAVTVGIGNVAASTNVALDGLSVSYTSGTATVGLDIDSLTTETLNYDVQDIEIPYLNAQAVSNKKASLESLIIAANSATSKKGTIAIGALSGTVIVPATWGFDTMVQTVSAAGDTVFCDISRTATSVTATIAATEATAITILVQKIG